MNFIQKTKEEIATLSPTERKNYWAEWKRSLPEDQAKRLDAKKIQTRKDLLSKFEYYLMIQQGLIKKENLYKIVIDDRYWTAKRDWETKMLEKELKDIPSESELLILQGKKAKKVIVPEDKVVKENFDKLNLDK